MRLRIALLACLMATLSACSHNGAGSALLPLHGTSPQVVQTGSVDGWKTFPLAESGVFSNAPAHDGNIWMIFYPDVMKVSMSGSESIYKLFGQPIVAYVESMTPNPDGNMYVPEQLSATSFSIARVSPDGVITEISLPGTTFPRSLVSGSDGNIWMTRDDPNRSAPSSIGRLNLDGGYTDFPVHRSWGLQEIVRGSDKNLWVEANNQSAQMLVRVSVVDGSFRTFALPDDTAIGSLVSGSDGGLWIPNVRYHCTNCHGIYRFDPTTFQTTFYPSKHQIGGNNGQGVISGPNHKLYWMHADQLVAWDLATHQPSAHYQLPANASGETSEGPDGQIWIGGANAISSLIIHPIITTPASITVAVGMSAALSVVEKKSPQKAFTALSNDPSIATVSGAGESFQVRGVKAGTTTITISDEIGNSLDVPVTVQ